MSTPVNAIPNLPVIPPMSPQQPTRGTALMVASNPGGGLTPRQNNAFSLVGGWLRALQRSATTPRPGQPLEPRAIPRVTSPSQFVPSSAPALSTVLSPASRMRASQGLPQLTRPLGNATASLVENALAPRLAQFQRLSPAQQEVARGLLSAVLDAAQKRPWQAGRLAASEVPQAVQLALDAAQDWREPQPQQPLPQAPTSATTPDAALPQAPVSATTQPQSLPQAPSSATATTQPGQSPPVTEQPKLVPKWQRSAGQVSVALRSNINYVLRDIADDRQLEKITVKPYEFLTDPAKAKLVQGEIEYTLVKNGGMSVTEAPAAAQNLMKIAEAMNIDASRLAVEVTSRLKRGRELVASVNPRSPLLVDDRSPASKERAVSYFKALYAQGEYVPSRKVIVNGHEMTAAAFLRTTPTMTDLDGVVAGSYGEYGLEILVTDRQGKKLEVYLGLGKALEGAPTRVLGVQIRPNESFATVELNVRQGDSNQVVRRTINVPVTREQARVLLSSAKTEVSAVEGLTARFFPPQAMQLLKAVSEQDGRGAEFPGGVKSNEFIGNTFGTAGEGEASSKRPGELVRSIQRSTGDGITVLPVGRGFPAVPNFKVYSGGAALTDGELVQEPFGLDPKDAQGIRAVAGQLNGVVEKLSQKYGLSKEQIDDWKSLNFTNADIPSIILPSSVVEALVKRGNSQPGRGLRDLQTDIENSVQGLINSQGVGDKYRIHHTASQGNDELKLADFGTDGKLTGKLTTEWQINVKSGKALPVLDALARRLQNDHGYDLIADLKSRGYDYNRLRQMELPEVIELFKTTVRPLIESRAREMGRPLTGKMIIQVDTYGETTDAAGNRKRGGSDRSLIDAARALYGQDNVAIVQVDTLGGARSSLRQPEFDMQLGADGNPVLNRPSVSPDSKGSPSVYVRNPSTLGDVLNGAYRSQFPIRPSAPEANQPEKKTNP